jgi:EAL domain-containing protein (putative c-di-GMP-specific phosphodiesterase class I)
MPLLTSPVAQTTARRSPVDEIIRRGAVRSVYQPIVALPSGEVIGYEALARGPEGTDLESPLALFAAAREAGLVVELEWACRAAALRGALAAGLPRSLALFVNVEPNLVAAPVPEALESFFAEASARLRLVFEITERALVERPADLLRRIHHLRSLGAGIAIDDVGADPRSLALMPFIEPDVIKLDLRLIRERPSAEIARIMHSVSAEAERSGARVVAEGIETAEHAERALVLGADLGQGWRYGRPEPLAAFAAPANGLLASRPATDPTAATPFEIVAAERTVRRGSKRLLLDISRQIETRVAQEGNAAVLLATFQERRHFTPATAELYAGLARSAAFVGALGHGLGGEPVPGVRGGHLAADDPLRAEWNVAVVGPHFAAAFVGRDLGDEIEDLDRRFDFAITHDRGLAIRAATAMMAHVAPLP